ncbi:MAG TPA: histidine phosphatase family protein [Xanthobacteraceae bacterium]
MIKHSRREFGVLTASAVVGLALSLSPQAKAADAVDYKALSAQLKGGGFVILVRHGATFSDQADTNPWDLSDISKQRLLNDKGKELARAFGEALRAAGVPVGKVYTSKFNRAYQTAQLAGFTNIETTFDLSEGGLVVSPDENARRTKALLALLAQAPEKGTNTVLITHKPNIGDALGKDWWDVKEGEASIFKPEGGKYALLTRVQMDEWPKIAAAAK